MTYRATWDEAAGETVLVELPARFTGKQWSDCTRVPCPLPDYCLGYGSCYGRAYDAGERLSSASMHEVRRYR